MTTETSFPSHLICQMCSKPFTNPRMLPCLHSFCHQCLVRESDGSKQIIKCRTCQRIFLLPVGGTDGLPQNIHLEFEVEVAGCAHKLVSNSTIPCTLCVTGCTDPAVAFCCTCHQFLCTFGHLSHKRVPGFSEHKMVQLGKASATQLAAMMEPNDHYCSQPKHMNEKMALYCKTCSHLICRECASDSHREHDTTTVSNTAQAYRDELRQALQCVEEALFTLLDAIKANDRMKQLIEASKHNVKSTIEETFKQLFINLDNRKKTLLEKLESISLTKIKPCTIRDKHLEKIQQEMTHCTEVTSHILQTHTDHEVVVIRDIVSTELKATVKKVKDIPITPNERGYLEFSSVRDTVIKEISNFGDIVDIFPSPSCSKFILQPVARVNKKYEVSLETMSSIGERYSYGGIVVKAELRPNLQDRAVVTGEVEDHWDGTYTIALTPQSTGPHQLHITMDGKHVKNSPYDLEVKKREYTTLCNPEQVMHMNAGPYCIAIHENGDLYAGCSDHHIYVFDKCGHLKNTFGGIGYGIGQFDGPFGICVKKDVMFVADWGNNRIQKLTTDGKFLDKFGAKGTGQGQFNGPWGVVVDRKDRIIVSDDGNNRIQVFEINGTWLLTIAGQPYELSYLQSPRGLCIDCEGNIHVACSTLIKVFKPEGSFITIYGNLKRPEGISCDEEGYILINECGANCVSIFDLKGKKIHTVQGLSRPTGIVLDTRCDSVYIANFGNTSVHKW